MNFVARGFREVFDLPMPLCADSAHFSHGKSILQLRTLKGSQRAKVEKSKTRYTCMYTCTEIRTSCRSSFVPSFFICMLEKENKVNSLLRFL